MPATVHTGDLILVQVNNNGPAGRSITAPTGWALVPGSANPNSPTATMSTWWFYKIATATDAGTMPGWTWSGGNFYWSMVLATYANVNGATPFRGSNFTGGSGTVPVTQSVTSVVAGDEVTAWVSSVGGPTLASGNLTQEVNESTQQNAALWDHAQSSSTVDSYQWTMSSAHSWTAALIALRPGTAPTTTPPTTTPPTTTPPPTSLPSGRVALNVVPSFRPWHWAGGPNPDSWWDPATGISRVNAEMPLVAQSHAATVRAEFPWTYIETAKGTYDWRHSDAIAAAAVASGVAIQAIIVFCPAWEGAPNCVPNPNDYQSFVTAMATRYKGRIHMWEFGNEPDLSRYFNGTEAQWISTMLNPGYAAAKAVDPTNVVVSAGMAYPSNLGWIDALKASGAHFDAQAYHDYPGGAAQVNSDGWALRTRMNADGYSSTALWLDEFGVQDNTTNDTTQQSWINDVYAAGANPATRIALYNLRDDLVYCSATSVCKTDYYGLLQHDLTPKLALRTFQAQT